MARIAADSPIAFACPSTRRAAGAERCPATRISIAPPDATIVEESLAEWITKAPTWNVLRTMPAWAAFAQASATSIAANEVFEGGPLMLRPAAPRPPGFAGRGDPPDIRNASRRG